MKKKIKGSGGQVPRSLHLWQSRAFNDTFLKS